MSLAVGKIQESESLQQMGTVTRRPSRSIVISTVADPVLLRFVVSSTALAFAVSRGSD